MAVKFPIWVGPKPPSKDLTWRYLTLEARELLKEERWAGRFGGNPYEAPYWWAQERGEPKASIEPLLFLRGSVKMWESTLNNKIRRFIRG